jgi:hypothetical protein
VNKDPLTSTPHGNIKHGRLSTIWGPAHQPILPPAHLQDLKMQFTSLALLALSALAIAAPSSVPANTAVSPTTQSVEMDSAIYSRLEKAFQDAAVGKQTATISARAGSDVRNDVINGICNDIILIYARGTYGSGNIGTGIGVAFADNLIAQRPGKVAVQGVQPYAALVVGFFCVS